MKRALVAAVVVGVAVFAAMAWSAAPPSPAERTLMRNVAALQKQVKLLQVDVGKLKKDEPSIGSLAVHALLFGACNAAVTADALQGTWNVIDQLSAATQAGKVYFGPQTPVSDTLGSNSVCQLITVTRSQAVPPTIAPFAALLQKVVPGG